MMARVHLNISMS